MSLQEPTLLGGLLTLSYVIALQQFGVHPITTTTTTETISNTAKHGLKILSAVSHITHTHNLSLPPAHYGIPPTADLNYQKRRWIDENIQQMAVINKLLWRYLLCFYRSTDILLIIYTNTLQMSGIDMLLAPSIKIIYNYIPKA
jgi:hypothetical protein